MDEQLYLFEVLIDDIYLEDASGEIPTKKQLVITVTLGSVVTLEIRSETLPLKGSEGSSKRHIEFKCGKSYLCFSSPDKLLDAIERKPIEIVVGIKGDVQPISSTTVPWDDCFKEMITESKDVIGFLTPASIVDNFLLMNNDVKRGSIQMFLRVSCFGKSLQTQYEVNLESRNRQFVFKSPYMISTFMCSRYGTGDSTDFLPVSPMYTITNTRNEATEKATPSDQSVSWTAIGNHPHDSSFRSSAQSECFFPEYLTNVPPAKTSTLTFDIVSLMDRPEEDKFIDFNTGRRVSDPHEKHENSTIHSDDSEGKETIIFFTDSRPTNVERKVDIAVSISAEKLSKACQCPKTPIICQHVLDAIKRYEKSHPDLMIHGKKVKYDKILKNSNDDKKDMILRLKGGNDEESIPPFKHKKKKGCYNRKCKMAKQLRSVGISQLAEVTTEKIDSQKNSFCAEFFCPESAKQNLAIQVNFSEDEIPFNFSCQNKYCPAANMFKKLGLGPLAIEKCQGTIYGPVTPPIQYGISQTYGIFDTYGPFGIFSTTNTPFLPDCDKPNDVKECSQNELKGVSETKKDEKVRCEECYTKTKKKELDEENSTEINVEEKGSREVLRLRGGVASETCFVLPSRLRAGAPSRSPIAECQEVMEQFDQILEEYRNALGSHSYEMNERLEEYMPFSKTGNCGHARCTYISEPILPPIHWDCPDPLPLGFCENPDCPHLPQDLRRFGRILSAKRRRDASDSSSMELQNHTPKYHCNRKPECFITNNELYTFKSNCPFSNPPKIVNVMQFNNNYTQQGHGRSVSEPCSNPECPLKQHEMFQSCSNPDCPLKLQEITNSCSNPDCPLKQRGMPESCFNPDSPLEDNSVIESCSYLEFPIQQKQTTEQCANPHCPNRKVSDESCQNPDCPLKMQVFSFSRETCENFEGLVKYKEQSLLPKECENPECPFKSKKLSGDCNATSASQCSNPYCLVHKQSCSNPDCPLKQLEKCENPKCPYKSQQASRKKGVCGPSSQSICGDATCPFNIEADGDKKGDKQDQLTSSKSQDGGGDKKQTEEKPFDQAQLERDNYEEGSPVDTKGDRPSHYDMAPCTIKTCEFMGGRLPCVDCATITKGKKINIKVCPGTMRCRIGARHSSHLRKPRSPESAKRALKRERKKFVYHIGDTYPGTHVGHKECVVTPFNVPAKMGWLWNIHTPCLRLKRRNGWRPGLIGKTILEVIQAHRKSQNMAQLEQGKKKRKNKYGFVESETEIIYPKPTLQIKKREGVYYITMNPLKDPTTLVNNENPYMECTPMQFKIIKNKDNSYKSCICNDQGLLYEQSSSSDSELDLEFTPPAGVIRPERFIRPRDVIHTDTQYNAKDFAVPVEKPKPDAERGSSEEKSRDKGKKGKKKKGKNKKK